MQPFPYTAAVTLGAENRLMVTTPNSNQVFETKSDWMPFGASPDANISSTDTVFVGYGIVSSEQKRDDYAGKDVTGKVVYAFDGSPEKDNQHDAFAKFDIYTKAKIAKDKGAIALVLISREADFKDDKSTTLDYNPVLDETAIPVVSVSRSVAVNIFGSEAEMQKAERGEAANQRSVKTQLKVNLDKKSDGEGYNVIGVLEGTDAALKNEAIVIGAHYDHLGRGGQGSLAANSAEIHHGADDNASGVAGLIELARRFSAEKRNKRTIIFIAFGGEEEGLLGSKFYVNNPVFPLVKTVAMINMDMIGRLRDNKLTIGGIGTASEWKSLVESLNFESLNKEKTEGNLYGNGTSLTGGVHILIHSFSLQLNEDGFGPSDHSSFYSKQIPVLFFFTGTHLDYHKPSDTADKINFAGLNQVVNYVFEIVKAIDSNPKRPTYTVAKSSGTGEGRRGFNVSLGTIPSYADSSDGLILDGVRDDSPAAKAGLKAGDKIIKLAGKEVRNVSDYTIILGELKAGVEYEIVTVRTGQTLNLKIIPAARK
ncbi:MAG: M20/M25/M40 family metallo-hydrolase [Pyrinomonadaceae bacterium]